MFSLTYKPPTGDSAYSMLQGKDRMPFISADSLSGLVGQFEDSPVQVIGVPGGRVDMRDRVVSPMEGSFTVVVFTAGQWVQVRRDFSPTVPGTLVLEGESRCELPVRLSASLPSPGTVPTTGAGIEVSVVADGGVWERAASGTGSVTVTNSGDVPVWPEIVWSGAGGRVILPSGAALTLPAAESESRLPLQRTNAGRVWVGGTHTSTVDAVGEMVPVGEARTYTIPDGARLEWKIGVFDPWI